MVRGGPRGGAMRVPLDAMIGWEAGRLGELNDGEWCAASLKAISRERTTLGPSHETLLAMREERSDRRRSWLTACN